MNFIGVDISVDILGVARRNIEAEFGEQPVENVALLSYNIEKLDTLFAPEEKADRIYVNFCNQWQKAGDHKRRLTHTRQLETYKKILAPGGELWFKTDNMDLYLATQMCIRDSPSTTEVATAAANLLMERTLYTGNPLPKAVRNALTTHLKSVLRPGTVLPAPDVDPVSFK